MTTEESHTKAKTKDVHLICRNEKNAFYCLEFPMFEKKGVFQSFKDSLHLTKLLLLLLLRTLTSREAAGAVHGVDRLELPGRDQSRRLGWITTG